MPGVGALAFSDALGTNAYMSANTVNVLGGDRSAIKRNIFLKKLAGERVFPYGIDDQDDGDGRGRDQVLEHLTGAYSMHDRILGIRVASMALSLHMRPLLLTRMCVKSLQLAVLLAGVHTYGVLIGFIIWLGVYIATRPVIWFIRKSLLCLAESILRRQILTLGETVYGRLVSRCFRYALLKNIKHIPAKSLINNIYSKTSMDFLPDNLEAREIALKLADQFDGSLADLITSSTILAQ